MKIAELRDFSNEELNQKLEDLREELFKLRFQKAMNRLENPLRMSAVRKDIARIKTLQTERAEKR
jgi:large subunit ribosomal protein L29